MTMEEARDLLADSIRTASRDRVAPCRFSLRELHRIGGPSPALAARIAGRYLRSTERALGNGWRLAYERQQIVVLAAPGSG